MKVSLRLWIISYAFATLCKFLSVEDGFALLAILAQCSYEIIRKMLCIPQDQRDSETVGVLTRST